MLEYDYAQYREVIFNISSSEGVWPEPGTVIQERTTSKQYTVLYSDNIEKYIECAYADVTGVPQSGNIDFGVSNTLAYTSFVVQ